MLYRLELFNNTPTSHFSLLFTSPKYFKLILFFCLHKCLIQLCDSITSKIYLKFVISSKLTHTPTSFLPQPPHVSHYQLPSHSAHM